MRRMLVVLMLVISIDAYTQTDRIMKDLDQVAVNIRSVQRYPVFNNGSFYCFVRLVVFEYGWEEIYAPLSIQWIFDDSEKRIHYVKYKKLVEETARLSNSIVSVKSMKDSLQVELIGRDPIGLEESKYVLTIRPKGTYEIKQVPK